MSTKLTRRCESKHAISLWRESRSAYPSTRRSASSLKSFLPSGGKSLGVAESFILDASAVLALIRGEPGASAVRAVLPRARIHALNMVEVVRKLVEVGVPSKEVELSLDELQIPFVEEFTVSQALAVGKLAAAGRKYGLS